MAAICALASAFFPTKYIAWRIRGRELRFDDVATHEDMTRKAILEVAASTLKDNPNPSIDDSTSSITSVSMLSVENLIVAYYGNRDRGKIRAFENAIFQVSIANAKVDLEKGDRTDASAHFDSEQF